MSHLQMAWISTVAQQEATRTEAFPELRIYRASALMQQRLSCKSPRKQPWLRRGQAVIQQLGRAGSGLIQQRVSCAWAVDQPWHSCESSENEL